ncbi:threonine synthase [Propionispira raffinosivorans]|uniref:threonine synthase n=1 Tax=Propionispira raffinosivorans TaxID=86959 RepID=UPI00036623AA|nr:threonine synthase [Propionispira raffinosivorans]
MKYRSTRGNEQILKSAEAIIAGIAEDGGLFIPTELPKISPDFLKSLLSATYQECAEKILGQFLTDYTPAELKQCVEKAYGNSKFDTDLIAPLQSFVDHENILELWHGPTSAFKDMALQLLPQLMSTALVKTGEKSEIVILVATSGDTGKAALEGFKDVDQIRIMVFYPKAGVSKIQRQQMVTQTGENVAVAAVTGNFDDAQTGVKRIFNDVDFNKMLKNQGFQLSSANSINWGRLVPQIVYYFNSYAQMVSHNKIKFGDSINFVVPTGNFGNILAGFYAKCMGLPINKLVCASNANNVLTDFLRTGIYNRQRDFFKTITPSMDILISSNLERLLYHIGGGDSKQICRWMSQLAEVGSYNVGADYLAKIQSTFWAGWADDKQTAAKIKAVYQQHNYIVDTHTAVAWQVSDAYKQITEDTTPTVIVSTASPYKFNDSVLDALAIDKKNADEFDLLDTLAKYNSAPIPIGLANLRTAKVLHQQICTKEDMINIVKTIL